MTQARKLKLRDKLPEWARLVDLDGLKAVAEAEMLEGQTRRNAPEPRHLH